MTTLESNKLIRKALRLQVKLEAVRPLYTQMDQVTEALVNNNITEGTVGRYRIFITDNFRQKNTAWKSSAFRRYEVKIEKRPTKLEPFVTKRR
jgi:hypothetical protein